MTHISVDNIACELTPDDEVVRIIVHTNKMEEAEMILQRVESVAQSCH